MSGNCKLAKLHYSPAECFYCAARKPDDTEMMTVTVQYSCTVFLATSGVIVPNQRLGVRLGANRAHNNNPEPKVQHTTRSCDRS